jgi:hypothetical protein
MLPTMSKKRRRPEPPEPEKKGYSLRLSQHMHAAMKRLAKKHRRPLSEEIRLVFDEYMERHKDVLAQYGLWPPPPEE